MQNPLQTMNREKLQARETTKREGCWPTWHQELLLKAGLLKGEPALDAWENWKANIDIDQLDESSHRLLPLLYKNLISHGVNDPNMNKLKGAYRLTWYKNRILFHNAVSILRSFHDFNIKALVLKGGALIPLYYKDYGIRPMADFDVLVHTEKALPAITFLMESGWTPKDFLPTDKYISLRYSHGFTDQSGQEFDLHWHVLSECCHPNADDDFWEGALQTEINGISSYVLNPADQMLHVCIHGMKWETVPSIRWISDAMVILRHSYSEIDWDRLIEQGKKRWLILPLKDTLNYLKDVFDAPVPVEVLKRINKLPVSRMQKIEFRTKNRQPTILTDFVQLWFQHSRLTGNTGIFARIVTFPGFLMNIWNLDHIRNLPFFLFLKVIRRMRH